MMETESGNALDISLREDAQGHDRVVLVLAQGCTLELSPHQARVVATELIMAVNRAEVRSNLRRSHGMVRSGENSGTQSRMAFHQALAK